MEQRSSFLPVILLDPNRDFGIAYSFPLKVALHLINRVIISRFYFPLRTSSALEKRFIDLSFQIYYIVIYPPISTNSFLPPAFRTYSHIAPSAPPPAQSSTHSQTTTVISYSRLQQRHPHHLPSPDSSPQRSRPLLATLRSLLPTQPNPTS
jgi:hypothetical protein